MTIETTAPPAATTAVPPGDRSFALSVARVLLLLMGLATTGGATYFTFFASPEQGGVSAPVDWVLGAWALTMGVGFVLAAVRLRPPVSARALRLTVGLIVAHVVFSVVKIVGYSETEAVTFLAVDVVVLALLAASRRR